MNGFMGAVETARNKSSCPRSCSGAMMGPSSHVKAEHCFGQLLSEPIVDLCTSNTGRGNGKGYIAVVVGLTRSKNVFPWR